MEPSKKPHKKSYSGALLEQISVPDPHQQERHFDQDGVFVESSAKLSLEIVEIDRARTQKLPALLSHFGISATDRSRWKKLAIALAVEHVPGFQAVRVKGAPITASVVLFSQLYRYFIREKAKRVYGRSRRRNDRDICKILLKDPDFRTAFPKLAKVSIKRLQNLVSESRSLRREYLKAVCELVAYARQHRLSGAVLMDNEDSILFGDMPPWASESPRDYSGRQHSQKVSRKGGEGSKREKIRLKH